jgi:hypothetical protein
VAKYTSQLSRIAVLAALVAVACSDDDETTEPDQTGGKAASGGATTGGSSPTGGSKSAGGSTSMGGDAAAGEPALGGSGGAESGIGGDAGSDAPEPGADFPPTSTAKAVTEWLDEGHYLDWACEEEKTVKDDGAAAIHVHGASSRVCSNILLATARGGDRFPRGSASVKEVYDADDNLLARMVAAKVSENSDAGDGWFWSDGASLAGVGADECTGCHAASGSDAEHPGAGDFVYFQVEDEPALPPTDDPALMAAWIDEGYYKDWTCEEGPTEKTGGAQAIHAHRTNRICSNARLAGSEIPDDEWPAGIASVKEVYDGDSIIGVDVYVKVRAKTDGGQGFFYYANTSTNGFGLAACASCHAAAGSDADHPGAGDFVYERQTEP